MEGEFEELLNDLRSFKGTLPDPSHQASIDQLHSRLDCLANLARATALPARRSKVKDMSAEVVDSNPYSRLMALQRMDIVNDYERIRGLSVAIATLSDINPDVLLEITTVQGFDTFMSSLKNNFSP